jgi:pSer/pThr/pTyr-binding forkhead associated (FHA) protein
MKGHKQMEFIVEIARYALPVTAVIILALCSVALLRRKPQSLGKVQIVNTHTGDVFPLTGRETSLGRHKNCDIILNYPSVSRQHAVIVCARDGWYIKEIGKGSPVMINGRQAEKTALLKSGDRIKLGEVTLVFKNKTVSVNSGGKNDK